MRERFKSSWLVVAVLLAVVSGAYAQIGPDRLAARIGDLPVNLVTRPGQCFLDEQQPTDRKVLDEFFRPRQGNLNTLLAAFMPCQQRAAFRESRFGPLQNFGYVLYFTKGASTPQTKPLAQYVRDQCQGFRAKYGSIDLTSDPAAAHARIEALMQAQPAGAGPRFGEIVGQDDNGCYQLILVKRLVNGQQQRDALVTVVTLIKGRQITYTRSAPYENASTIDTIARSVRLELAAILAANP